MCRTALQAFRLLRLGTRWRLRALPGPPALPILGNLPAVLRTPGGLTAYRDAMFKAYGYVYQVRSYVHHVLRAKLKLCATAYPRVRDSSALSDM